MGNVKKLNNSTNMPSSRLLVSSERDKLLRRDLVFSIFLEIGCLIDSNLNDHSKFQNVREIRPQEPS
jgi:hypothetical protein